MADSDEETYRFRKRKPEDDKIISCPFLDTIQRSNLDFDLEPTCSICLQRGPHIYACCVCGKFFRGRSRSSPAHTHSVEQGHYVFVHLLNATFHCLPDDYEIKDASLNDIRDALRPRFDSHEISLLDSNARLSRDLFGRLHLPGFVGLNNLKKTDYINAVVQALAHVRPLRDWFLANNEQVTANAHHKNRAAVEVTKCFGELVRKMWSNKRFKNHIDPYMLVNAITSSSKFQIGRQADAGEFIAWLLHQLHLGTSGGVKSKKKHKSIIEKVFQGKVNVTTRQAKRKNILQMDKDAEDDRAGSDVEESQTQSIETNDEANETIEIEETTMNTRFLQLTLDIAEKPLFRDEDGGLVIPQEPLVTVLMKFDGVTFCDSISRDGRPQRRKYALQKLPDYLILHLARFKNNQYSREKNPTIVAFPVKNLDLSDYVKPIETRLSLPKEDEIQKMSTRELKELMRQHGQVSVAEKCTEKKDLLDSALGLLQKQSPNLISDKYDLVANIIHDSPADVGREGSYDVLQEGSYKCHVQNKASNQWYEIQDLHVQEIMPQQIGVSESFVLIFERKSAQQQT